MTAPRSGAASVAPAGPPAAPAAPPVPRRRAPLARLWSQAAGVRWRLLGAAVVGALATGCAVGLMATSAWLIARAAQQPPVLYLMVAVVSVRTLGIGRGVLRYVERLISHDAAFRVLGGIRQRLVAHLALIAPAALPVWRRGDLLARTVDDVDDAGDAFLRGLLPLAGAALVGAGTVVLLALILPAAGVALAVALVVACVLVPVLSARRSARVEGQAVQIRAGRTRLVTELLDDLPELTVSDGLAGRLDELDRIETDSRRIAAGTARAAGVAAAVAVAAMGAAVWVAAWFGVPAVAAADLNPVLLAVIVLTPLALTDTVQAVGVAAAALHRATAALRRLFAVMDTPPVTAPPPVHPRPLPEPAAGATIRLRGVGARWPGADRDALTDIDLDLVPGRRIVVAGESGSGKSTLLAVLLGFLTPTTGRITLDGVDVAELDPDQVRTWFSWCDQSAHLFDSTVLENVRLARPDADAAQVEAALREAGAGGWLDGLPQGLDTPVGEHGRAVSGGERQRIALARAILADRPVLLADEPAAHLDGATAESVTAGIMRPDPGRCVLLVSHRPQDEALADQVVRLAGGRRVG
ncbi:MAG TPA: thiol reductant ABC exporter subunit CydC [Nakamurella multipartita]|nr:thiol reductant ABC exporter subunit CydC [Nakamurella multipartita]